MHPVRDMMETRGIACALADVLAHLSKLPRCRLQDSSTNVPDPRNQTLDQGQDAFYGQLPDRFDGAERQWPQRQGIADDTWQGWPRQAPQQYSFGMHLLVVDEAQHWAIPSSIIMQLHLLATSCTS